MTDPGDRPHLLTFQRQGAGTDDGYTVLPGTWYTLTTAWARIRHGSGQERREAAQENASQAATFECDWSPDLAAVLTTDRIIVFDTAWDITNRAVIGGNREVHFTAVANLDAVIDS